jgi:hypothetical protein
LRTIAAGTSEPPEVTAFSDDRSVVAKLGCSVMATSIVGTAISAVALYVPMQFEGEPRVERFLVDQRGVRGDRSEHRDDTAGRCGTEDRPR